MYNIASNLNGIFSGAPVREARQWSTMGKKFWETHEGKKIWCVRPRVQTLGEGEWSPKAAPPGVGGGE